MKNILTLTSIIESTTGITLLVLPSFLIKILFSSTLDTPITLIVARVAGAAIFALGIACWFARNEGLNPAARGLVIAMLLYNTVIALVLIYAALGLLLSGFGLWPVVLLHMTMSVWCIINLSKK